MRQIVLVKISGKVKKQRRYTPEGWEEVKRLGLLTPEQISTLKIEIKTYHVYVFEAWVHPSEGGDDYEIQCSVEAENNDDAVAALRAQLRKEGSEVMNDFKLVSCK